MKRREVTEAERQRRLNADRQRRFRAKRQEALRRALFERSISEPLSL